MMDGWWRIRESATKLDIEQSQIDLPAHIKTRMARKAISEGAHPVNDRFVYVERAGDWYVTFGLEINAPEYAIEKLRSRGWEIQP